MALFPKANANIYGTLICTYQANVTITNLATVPGASTAPGIDLPVPSLNQDSRFNNTGVGIIHKKGVLNQILKTGCHLHSKLQFSGVV